MARYEKWLGAGLGWAITGNPIGGLLGFVAGSLFSSKAGDTGRFAGVSEFETNLVVLASHLIKIDGKIALEEITFVKDFLNAHFDEKHAAQRTEILNHCLQKEYDLSVACDQIRVNTPHATRVQVVHFLIELAMADGVLNERENYFIFRIAGYLNVNDVDFRRIKKEHVERIITVYDILGVQASQSFVEIRTAYRKLVLKYHPDRNKDANDEERKKLALKFQQIQEAYEKIKAEREHS